MSSLSTISIAFDVKRRLPTLFPVLRKPEVVSNGQTIEYVSIYCIKVEEEVEYHEFLYAVSAIFLRPVWPEMAVGGIFVGAKIIDPLDSTGILHNRGDYGL